MKRVIYGISLFFLLFFIYFNNKNINALKAIQKVSFPVFSQLPTPLLKVATLGFKDLYDDYAFVWVLQELVKPSKASSFGGLKAKVDFILLSSPKIESLYTLSCFVFMFGYKDISSCLDVLSKGAKTLPKSWRISLTQGYVYAFERKEYKKAFYYYRRAAKIEGSPAYLESFSKKLLEGNVSTLDRKKSLEILFDKKEN